ncbi:MAG: TRAP transporter substrate-binding protein [Gammaproteobacteria bacterium]|nr:TRAP transporter substrate-binding protein [Gammaproteobacteria bacterium]NIR83061.1 TRAP transporter substrate-binding protein [Gammaproteobacteria bacterium]NIR90723.1 TRAP transporter substrate-binding protein [Gammaproteobacteria bacterium]NIU04214.1 TRAP transporter substrate-binding protein [Gammaproteobacteria bacterium]NIV51506.1 C4-dicarboxylate ABC transporter substrate-binding protein [Gammaproteobacteria bacterium]
MRKIVSFLAATALAGIAWSAQALTWDMPTPYGETNFHTVNIKQFAEDVEAATEGALTIKVHSAGSLFKHPEIKNAVRGGQVPVGEFLLSRLANENAVFQVDSIPFLATSYEDARRLWRASRPLVEKLLAEEGLQVLFSVPWPPQGLYAKKAVDSTEDLKGLKFRAYNTATERLAELAGAVPTQVEVPDIPQAFATGRVEAMITSPSTGANTKAWDFVSHFHHTQAWLPKNIVVVNKRAFDRLDPDIQEAVLAAAAQAEDRGWEMSTEETAAKIEILREHGMTIHNPPSRRLMKGLKDIGSKMTADWAERAGDDGQAILEAYRQ